MSTDDGLTEAVQRVVVILHRDYDDEFDAPHLTPQDFIGQAERIARAAREDVADLTRQAQADALKQAAHDPTLRSRGHSGISVLGLLERAAAIREGREP